jgi:hypothetical protein
MVITAECAKRLREGFAAELILFVEVLNLYSRSITVHGLRCIGFDHRQMQLASTATPPSPTISATCSQADG